MDLHLKDKVFIVTGGAKGIGEGITRGLAAEGAIPVIASRAPEGAAVAKSINDIGIKAHAIKVELRDPASSKLVVEETLKLFGRIDGVVNNAGANDGIGLESGTPEKFRESFHRNLFHYYDMVHYALPALIKSKGSIVNISSKTAITGQGNTSAYAAAKGAQLALTREWAVELLRYGVRVNAIVPAEVMTPLYETWLQTLDNPKEKLEEIVKRIPLGQRMTSKEEIASMVLFLLSDHASHITGEHLFVDGGYVHLDMAALTLN